MKHVALAGALILALVGGFFVGRGTQGSNYRELEAQNTALRTTARELTESLGRVDAARKELEERLAKATSLAAEIAERTTGSIEDVDAIIDGLARLAELLCLLGAHDCSTSEDHLNAA